MSGPSQEGTTVVGADEPEGSDPFIDAYVADRGNWQALRLEIAGQSELNPELLRLTLEALDRLEAYLGENFPADAMRSGHPITEYFYNRAPWTRLSLVHLAEVLDRVLPLEGSKAVLGRLLKAAQAPGAMAELEIASQAIIQGLDVRLEPEGAPGRKVDLLAVPPNEGLPVFVEVTQIAGLGRAQHRSQEIFERVVPTLLLIQKDLWGGGGLWRMPTDDEVDGLLDEVDAFWLERIQTRSPGEIRISDLLALWAADHRDADAKAQYLAAGYPEGFSGAPFIPDPLQRIYRRVADKAEQLPEHEAGLLVIQPPSVSLP